MTPSDLPGVVVRVNFSPTERGDSYERLDRTNQSPYIVYQCDDSFHQFDKEIKALITFRLVII